MRLWHENLLPKLPRQQLLGQHRECCALRGNGWGKKHATVNYVFQHSPYKLYLYHMKVINEMKRRGYQNDVLWEDPHYRGKTCPPFSDASLKNKHKSPSNPIYPEHDQQYLQACIKNLAEKRISL
ncbi:TIGR02328 family protein [Lentibacillus kapialis]|uniref:TIGR02328 family protein n=1 Tax=Lentibacillus kapialis TaxID=340214 RepID=UPI00166A4215|nr:TIGR02328 family protein [Lentibacillus kapialis]